ncbi:MAG: choline/carnitine O-acyltransferase [Simkaniaceae bacterium]|nr:choline/carnitine O-acyltransferase [Simkaniaceae bacterium]
MSIDRVRGGFGGFCGVVKERPGQTLAITGLALGILTYAARTWGLPYLLKRQGYFESKTEGALVKGLTHLSRQKMDAFEGDLPSLTPPSLDQSCEHLKKEGEVLLEGEALTLFLAEVSHFQYGPIGRGLQGRLLEISEGKDNYIQEIWEREAYLKGRYLFYSNWFGLSTPLPPPMEGGDPQLIRATYMIEGAVDFLDRIRRKKIPPFFPGIPIPVSMKQFNSLFGSHRVPGVGLDFLESSQEEYFIVMCQGNYYQVPLRQSREKLFADLQLIRQNKAPPQAPIGIFTTTHRDAWAKIRSNLITDPTNQCSLEAIQKGQFILCLEDERVDGLNGMSQIALLKMWNRHFDAGMQWIIDLEGKCATNNEHTGAESTVQAQMLGDVLAFEATQLQDGKLIAPQSQVIGEIHPLYFKVSREVERTLVQVRKEAEKKAAEYRVSTFETAFGKRILKKQGVSPDAFMQMCNLVAFYEMTGELSAIYETAMMRLFRGGRTETINTLTHEAKALALAIKTGGGTRELLINAIKKHKEATLDAMRNRGHERHMLALSVIARDHFNGLRVPLFENEGYRLLQRKRISSSQTPTDTGGGGFLPTEEDGVGISYIPREDYFVMTVTTKELDIEVFKRHHAEAMTTLLALLQKK